jgi:hypothetical protein
MMSRTVSTWTVSGLSAFLLMSVGCSQVSFDDTGLSQQSNSSIDEVPPAGGVIKNSYFFVKRTADILFVIDTSGSMAEEQALLKSGFPSFTSTINSYSGGTLDWHIAITTTDVASAGIGKQGALVPFTGLPAGTYYLDGSIDAAKANTAFQNTVALGTAGSGDERGIAAARLMAQREYDASTTLGFLRADTPLSVIVLSDEDERSTRDTTSAEYTALEPIDEPANFIPGIRALDTLSSGLKTITFHSIVTSSQACLSAAGVYMGTTYMQLSALTNGIVGDICALNQSYQDQLASLAVNIVNEARTYTLPCNKVADGSASIYEQTVNGALVLVPSTFLPPNKLVLKDPPAVGSLIKAHFTCMD